MGEVADVAGPTPVVVIAAGTYRPLYPPDPALPEVWVPAFAVEVHPVTVGQFAQFVERDPAWRPGAPPGVMADSGYLASWARQVASPDRPVTEVSWFAARAYCAAIGRRLPSEDEWERVARASPTEHDASEDEAWLATILSWYAAPGDAPLPAVAQGRANAWGAYDLHGVVWEWVDDFNNMLIVSDARESGDDERLRFCGVGAVSARDVRDYAQFMRLAMRSALEGASTTRRLGFRCATDVEGP